MINSSAESLLNLSCKWVCVCLPKKKSSYSHSFEIVFLNQKIKTELKIEEQDFLNQAFENLFPAVLFNGINEKMESVFLKGKSEQVENKKMELPELNAVILNFVIKKWENYLIIEIENIIAKVEEQKEQIEKQTMLEEANSVMNVGTWTLDMRTGKINSSINVKKFFETETEKEQFDLEDYYRHLVTEDIEHEKKEFANSIKSGVSFKVERKLKTSKGNLKFVEVVCKPIFDFDRCVKVVGVFRDITERKIQEQKIIDSEIALKENAALTDISHAFLKMGTYQVIGNEKIIYFSKNIGNVLDLPENILSLSFEDYLKMIHPDDQAAAIARLKDMFETKTPYIIERRMITRTGREIYTEITGYPIYENEVLKKFIGTLRDVTKKKNQEQQLIESKQQLIENAAMIKIAHDTLSMGTYTLYWDTKLISISEKVAEIFELENDTQEIALAEYTGTLQLEEGEETFAAAITNVIEKNIPYHIERKIKTKNGTIKHVENSGQPIYENGKIVKLVGTLRDISNRKMQENQLRNAEQQLQAYAQSLEEAHAILNMRTYSIDMTTGNISPAIDFINFFELPKTKKDFNVTDFMQFFSPEDQAEINENGKKILAGDTSVFTKEKKVITAKGNVKYIEIADKAIFENGICTRVVGTLRDITKRKAEENLLKETQNKLQENADMLHETHTRLKMGTYLMDTNTGIIETNFNLSKFYELKHKQTVFTIEDFFNYVAEDERHASKLNVRHAINKGDSYTKERKIITTRGNVKYLEITGQPFYENGKCTKLFGTIRDISERKTAEVKLQEAEIKLQENVERLMAAHQLLKTGTWSLNVETNHLTLSEEAQKITNNKLPKELSLSDFFTFFQEENRAGYMATLMETLNTFTPLTEVIHLYFDDGSYKYIDVIGQFSTDKKILGGTFRDITEAHEKDLALVKSEERFRDLFENTPSMYFIINEQGLIDDANQFGCDYLGVKKVEVIGQHHSILFHKEDVKLVSKNIELLKNSADNFLQWEARKRKKTGEVIWVKETARISTNKQGENIFLIVCEDITNEVVNRTLVRKKQEELISAKEKAEEAAKAKQQFASIMSHEIRTPLNAVIGMTNLLLMENPRENQINELDTLKFSAENLLLLVNDILDYSKIEAGKVMLEKISFDPRKLIFYLKNGYKTMVAEKGIFLTTNIDNALPTYLIGDPTRLAQILNNLISNAIKFTTNGIVEVAVRALSINDSALCKLRFEVSDTGVGIPKEKFNTIFESFSQVDSATTRKYGGTGLGLTITKKLVELHNSTIHIESELGKGSMFYFDIDFDIAEQLTDNDNFSNFELLKDFGNKKILLVEDNLFNQTIANRFLEKWNLEVDTVENGKQALQQLNQKTYDLILMDIHMPEMNGVETTQFIRTHENTALHTIPIIAITADVIDRSQQDFLITGMNDYIGKPFNPKELQRVLSKYLQPESNIFVATD